MNLFYPAFLDLRGKTVRVIGGGPVALQKIRSLVRCGAKVAVTAKNVLPQIKTMAARGRIKLELRPYRPADLSGCALAFCATNDEALNARVAKEGRKKKLWVNVADRPALCEFIVPAQARRGEVVVAVSTGGASPALAGFLRRKLERWLSPEIEALAGLLKKRRPLALKTPMGKRKKILEGIVNDRALGLLKRGRKAQVERELVQAFKPR